MKNWADDRVSSVEKSLEDKVKVSLQAYVSKTSKWDLESMKLDLTTYKSERAGRAVHMEA